MIPMVDLKTQYLELKTEIDSAIADVLINTQFILGPNVKTLEQEIGTYLHSPHAISCASGTDALHFALAAAGIKAGDEVITSAFTFIATAEAIRYVGATPVFVDINPRTFNLDPDKIVSAITPRTRAVIAVHLFGQPARLDRIKALCDARGLLLIEDCAQSFGATMRIDGQIRQSGEIGQFGCFSFFPSKNLGGYGDGGLVTAASDSQADRILMLRNHGSHVRYHHDIIGYNSRLDELQAAILRVKFRHIDRFNQGRRRVAHRYNAGLAGCDLVTPFEDGFGLHVFHQYTLLSDRREVIMKALEAEKIACAIYYPIPLHRQKVFSDQFAQVSLPVTESVSQRCLSLPIYPEMKDEQIDRVVSVIRNALAH